MPTGTPASTCATGSGWLLVSGPRAGRTTGPVRWRPLFICGGITISRSAGETSCCCARITTGLPFCANAGGTSFSPVMSKNLNQVDIGGPKRGSCLETGFSSPVYPATQPALAMTTVQGWTARFRRAVVPTAGLDRFELYLRVQAA